MLHAVTIKMSQRFPIITSMLTWDCPAAHCGRHVTSAPTLLRNTVTTSPGVKPPLRQILLKSPTSGLKETLAPRGTRSIAPTVFRAIKALPTVKSSWSPPMMPLRPIGVRLHACRPWNSFKSWWKNAPGSGHRGMACMVSWALARMVTPSSCPPLASARIAHSLKRALGACIGRACSALTTTTLPTIWAAIRVTCSGTTTGTAPAESLSVLCGHHRIRVAFFNLYTRVCHNSTARTITALRAGN